MKRLSVCVTAFLLLAAMATTSLAQQTCSRCCRPICNNNAYTCQTYSGSMYQPGAMMMSGQTVMNGQVVSGGQMQPQTFVSGQPVTGGQVVMTPQVQGNIPMNTVAMQPTSSGNYVSMMPGNQFGGYSGGGGGGLAQSKAQRAASMRMKGHVGGGLGGARYEGVGWSTVSAQSAIQSCCYWGRRPVAEVGVARGADGWYACVLYR
ncbi:MAG: hypothetical protein ACR2NP_23170 [Pirellulaceae bacterium]